MDKDENNVSRRNFLKIGGAAAAALQIGAVAGAGIAAGKDPATHTGWQHLGSNTQFVNRKPFEMDGLPYKIVGETRRPEDVENAFGRNPMIMRSVMRARQRVSEMPGPPDDSPPANMERRVPPENTRAVSTGTSGGLRSGGRPPKMEMPPPEECVEPLAGYYKQHPEVYELDKERMEHILPKRREDTKKYRNYYKLIEAWSDSWGTSEPIRQPPGVSDFQMGRRRPLGDQIPFKSPALASRLIKKVAHHFGASMVGIAKLNPDWCYNHGLRGSKEPGSYEVPKHWEYVIAFGVPHQWEQVESNPNMGTSFDAYSRISIAARRLENFIKSLGYPARRHSPMDGYDLIAVPILADTGLGQQGRHGIIITPETGSNFRVAFVTTNLPMEIDKPIDFGVNEFCKDCKICAEICPSQSISYEETNEKVITRGYRHWEINQASCYNYWMKSMGGLGCRLCLIACPYSRKGNWVHTMARAADSKDPTGFLNNALIKMQKTLFKAPEAEEYLPPPDGEFANFKEPPEWLRVENYLDLDYVKPQKETTP